MGTPPHIPTHLWRAVEARLDVRVDGAVFEAGRPKIDQLDLAARWVVQQDVFRFAVKEEGGARGGGEGATTQHNGLLLPAKERGGNEAAREEKGKCLANALRLLQRRDGATSEGASGCTPARCKRKGAGGPEGGGGERCHSRVG
eukprot:359977-Chlamydomonas_euryale.AAC.3